MTIYIEQLERKYDREFNKLGDNVEDEARVPMLADLYYKIQRVRKEIEELKNK